METYGRPEQYVKEIRIVTKWIFYYCHYYFGVYSIVYCFIMTNLGLNRGGQRGCFLVRLYHAKKTFKILLLLAQEKILLDNPFYQLQKALWHNGAQRIGLTCFKLYWKLMCVLIWQKMFEFSSRKENTILKETSKSIKLETLLSLFSARSKNHF